MDEEKRKEVLKNLGDMLRCIKTERCYVLECPSGSVNRCWSFWLFKVCTCVGGVEL